MKCWALFCCSVANSCPTLCDSMDCSAPGSPVLHHLPELAQTYVHWVSDAIQSSSSVVPFSSCPQIFPSIRVFSNESDLRIRWSKYWNFSFSISSTNEHSGFISFRTDWFNLLAELSLDPRKYRSCQPWDLLEIQSPSARAVLAQASD